MMVSPFRIVPCFRTFVFIAIAMAGAITSHSQSVQLLLVRADSLMDVDKPHEIAIMRHDITQQQKK